MINWDLSPRADCSQDGKPYIQLASASPTHDDPRNKGYTMVARTVFNSKEDFDYYDTQCETHNNIKAFLKTVLSEPPLMVFMDTESHN